MRKTKSVLLIFLLILTLLVLPAAAQVTPAVSVPDEVWVDDDFTSDTPGWGVTHFPNLHLAVGSVAANGTVYVAPGTYGPASVDTAGIRILGETGAILDGTGHDVAQGLEINVPGVTVTGLRFDNWTGQVGTAAIRLQSGSPEGSDTIISGCTFFNNNYGIWSDTERNIISENYFNGSLYFAMHFSESDNMIMGNTVKNSRYAGILAEGNYNTISHNFVFQNNSHYSGNWLGAITAIGNDSIIANNTVEDNGNIGIYVMGHRNSILNNEASRNGESGGWRGIHLFGSNNEIINNQVLNNYSSGIEIESSQDFPADNNLVQGNTVMNNRDSGLFIWDGTSTIVGNRVSENGYSGIQVMRNASGSLISGNVCDSNGDYGIQSRGGNRIIGNTVRYNQRPYQEDTGGGISADAGDEIHFNNIYGNSPYGLETWLGAEIDSLAVLNPLDAQNNWWGHPDGPVVMDLIVPYSTSTEAPDHGDSAAGLLTTTPWLQKLTLSGSKAILTVGQNETITVVVRNSDNEPAGNNNLSVKVRINGDSATDRTLNIHNGQGTFTYKRNSPGTDTIEMSLLIAGEPTGMVNEETLVWAAGDTPPDGDDEEELPHTGMDMSIPLFGLMLLGTGLYFCRRNA